MVSRPIDAGEHFRDERAKSHVDRNSGLVRRHIYLPFELRGAAVEMHHLRTEP